MSLDILYRGPLVSCNYACAYCPFAKRRESREEQAADRGALARFIRWVRDEGPAVAPVGVLFTPWGEALVRRWYRDAMVELSHLDHVRRVAAQTNLSGPLDWVDRADLDTVALWATFHPSQIRPERFVARVLDLHHRGVRLSVGIVALPEHLELARRLRDELPAELYLWANAARSQHPRYTETEIADWSRLDPLFPLNTVAHESLGHTCRTGHDTVSVSGDGTVRRCHFVARPMGNLYDGTFSADAGPTSCPNRSCGCHIGYVHLERLDQRRRYGDGVLERVPASHLWNGAGQW